MQERIYQYVLGQTRDRLTLLLHDLLCLVIQLINLFIICKWKIAYRNEKMRLYTFGLSISPEEISYKLPGDIYILQE